MEPIMLNESSHSSHRPDPTTDNKKRLKLSADKYHRQILLANGMLQRLGNGFAARSLVTVIPTHITQAAFSSLLFFSPRPKPINHALQIVQDSQALLNVIFVIMLNLRNIELRAKNESVSKFLFLSALLYQGLLPLRWIPAEAFRHIRNRSLIRRNGNVVGELGAYKNPNVPDSLDESVGWAKEP